MRATFAAHQYFVDICEVIFSILQRSSADSVAGLINATSVSDPRMP